MQSLNYMSPEELLTPTETAEFLKVSADTLRRWRYERNGPRYVRVGRRMVRYTVKDLLAFLSRVDNTAPTKNRQGQQAGQ